MRSESHRCHAVALAQLVEQCIANSRTDFVDLFFTLRVVNFKRRWHFHSGLLAAYGAKPFRLAQCERQFTQLVDRLQAAFNGCL